MKNYIKLFLVLSTCSLLACNSNQKPQESHQLSSSKSTSDDQVPFEEAKNYFVKNTVGDHENGLHKIVNQAQFDSFFGPASTMSSQPTPIDFNKQFVIAMINPSSMQKPGEAHFGLTRADSTLTLSYHVHSGEEGSATYRTATILIVDKQYDGMVVLDERTHQH